MKNFVVRYGLYAGMVLIVLGLINWFFVAPQGYGISEVFGYASMVFALLAIPLAIKYYRDQLHDGQVALGEGLRIGFGVTAITSVIMGIYSYLFFVLQGDEFMAWYETQASPEMVAQAKAQMETMPEWYLSPVFQGFVMLLTVFFIGAIITLISALVMKRVARSQ